MRLRPCELFARANPAKQARAGRKHGSDDMIAAAASGVGKQREGEGSQEEGRKSGHGSG